MTTYFRFEIGEWGMGKNSYNPSLCTDAINRVSPHSHTHIKIVVIAN
ncbi:hypothetical protein GXM_04182 [Nostoc sphaeroides CCNUC1]|uniref:Uncharacterized protein n=1 Tax=Nostoc sphaeroides CCNUC1 TaxID=2653204 RepID=A0A5P8W278_9NOSO|nr:hypothetical protein GXM_04182 [Nostoc sphaeroides CCNUC1]